MVKGEKRLILRTAWRLNPGNLWNNSNQEKYPVQKVAAINSQKNAYKKCNIFI